MKYAAIGLAVLGFVLLFYGLFAKGNADENRHTQWCHRTLTMAPTASDSFQFMMRNPRCQP